MKKELKDYITIGLLIFIIVLLVLIKFPIEIQIVKTDCPEIVCRNINVECVCNSYNESCYDLGDWDVFYNEIEIPDQWYK